MPDEAQPQSVVEGQVFHEPVTVEEGRAAPSHGLYQPYYPLSEADYLRLKSPGSTLYGIGGGLLSFGIAYLLPNVIPWVLSRFRDQQLPFATAEFWTAVAIAAAGAVFLIGGFAFSSERRRVLKSVRQHFLENPGRPEMRMGGK